MKDIEITTVLIIRTPSLSICILHSTFTVKSFHLSVYHLTDLIPDTEYEVIVEGKTVSYPVKQWNWTRVLMVVDEPRSLQLVVHAAHPSTMLVSTDITYTIV